MNAAKAPSHPKRGLRGEELIALALAIGLHGLLVLAFLLQDEPPAPPPEPERMVVNLSTDVTLASTAPDPVSESRASQAPELSDNLAPPVSDTLTRPLPPRPADIAPPTRSDPVVTPAPRPTTRPTTRPSARPTTRPTSRPTSRATSRAAPARSTPSRSAPTRATPSARPSAAPTQSGGSRVGSDFLGGAGTSTTTSETRTPASQIGASARASLLSQITREVRPKFEPPSGVEVDKLVSVVRFNLDENGALRGRPSMVRQTGVTDANRAQAARHGEQAVRAVQLAAPFDLPREYYEAFKSVTLNFDASL